MLTQTQRSRSGQRALQCGRRRVSATGGGDGNTKRQSKRGTRLSFSIQTLIHLLFQKKIDMQIIVICK